MMTIIKAPRYAGAFIFTRFHKINKKGLLRNKSPLILTYKTYMKTHVNVCNI